MLKVQNVISWFRLGGALALAVNGAMYMDFQVGNKEDSKRLDIKEDSNCHCSSFMFISSDQKCGSNKILVWYKNPHVYLQLIYHNVLKY